MKKITLVLCACAMAFAGLLVSCSNDAGSDVELIYRGTNDFDYVYQFTATKVVTTETTPTSDKDEVLQKAVTTTSFEGLADIIWSEDDDTTVDYKNYKLMIKEIATPNRETTWSFSGSVYTANKATYDRDPEYIVNMKTDPDTANPFNPAYDTVYDSAYNHVPGFNFYEFAEVFYLGTASKDNTAAYTDAYVKKSLANTITVSGNIEEDDSVTITVTQAPGDLDPTEAGVNKTTTVWTYKLSKAGADAE